MKNEKVSKKKLALYHIKKIKIELDH